MTPRLRCACASGSCLAVRMPGTEPCVPAGIACHAAPWYCHQPHVSLALLSEHSWGRLSAPDSCTKTQHSQSNVMQDQTAALHTHLLVTMRSQLGGMLAHWAPFCWLGLGGGWGGGCVFWLLTARTHLAGSSVACNSETCTFWADFRLYWTQVIWVGCC